MTAQNSHRLLKLQQEIVDRHVALEAREVMRVGGIAPEIAGGGEFEARGFDLLAQGRFLDTMQGLADGGALAGQRRMIGDDKNAAGLERGEQFAIHLRAVDLHVGRVVVVEQEADQVEVRHARWNRIISAIAFFIAGVASRA